MLIASGLLVLYPGTVSYAEDMIVQDTEGFHDSDEADIASDTASEEFVSSEGLFEVVSETQSREGKAMEEAMPQPEIIPVPSTPPSSSLTVKTLKPYSSPADALLRYSKEYKHADIKYYSDSLFYTCTRKETDTGFYYLTHIIIKDASQINGEDSFGDFAGTRETVQDAAERTGAKIAINGSYFRYETGYAYGGDLLIRNNQVMHGSYSDGYEICLRKDGTLFSPGYNTIDSVLAQDVVFSWGTCEDLLIHNGEKCTLTDYDWNGCKYPRTAIGMVCPLEYYIITAGGADYSGGITIYEEQDIFSELGCAYARGLDGGGSSSLVIDGEYVNENGDRQDDGTLLRRGVADFLMIYETAPEDMSSDETEVDDPVQDSDMDDGQTADSASVQSGDDLNDQRADSVSPQDTDASADQAAGSVPVQDNSASTEQTADSVPAQDADVSAR